MSEYVKMPPCGETIVIISCYKRPEYTEKCIRAIESAQKYNKKTLFYLVDDGSNDGTKEILESAKLPWKTVLVNEHSVGLRNVLLGLFIMAENFQYMVKIDNDCLVPENWLDNITGFLKAGWADIVSPNVYPSDAAHKLGLPEEVGRPGLMPSKTVGGLWAMSTEMIKDINFESIPTSRGITGAFPLLTQIIVEKDARVGWLPNITVQDIGHWSGEHPEHIASESHRAYSAEIGRGVSW